MNRIPVTSISLLEGIASSSTSAKWTEFFRLYEEPMRGFMQTRFPSLEADDVIQETMIALMKAIPDYHYTPDDRGHFRNYLMGILKHKAMDALKKRKRAADHADEVIHDSGRGNTMNSNPMVDAADYSPAEDDSWKIAAAEAAIEQLLADESVSTRNREIFRHVALLHEDPEQVAADFGVSRNNVDQIKNRLMTRLRDLVAKMTAGE